MRRRIPFDRTLIVAVLAAPVALAGCAQTATYGTGEVPEMAMFREMSGGLMSKHEKPQINYQPRAPLVMPPTNAQLPAPGDAAASADANWPVDPDQQGHGPTVLASADPREAGGQAEYERTRGLADLLPHKAPSSAVNDEVGQGRADPYSFITQANGQRQKFAAAVSDSKGYTATERRYLTDPPVSYREPSPTAPTEFNGVGKKRHFWQRLLPGKDDAAPGSSDTTELPGHVADSRY